VNKSAFNLLPFKCQIDNSFYLFCLGQALLQPQPLKSVRLQHRRRLESHLQLNRSSKLKRSPVRRRPQVQVRCWLRPSLTAAVTCITRETRRKPSQSENRRQICDRIAFHSSRDKRVFLPAPNLSTTSRLPA
jgi:hypothetical protein